MDSLGDDSLADDGDLEGKRICTRIVHAVAESLDEEPNEIDESLYEAVDPDALRTIVRECDTALITFELAGRTVRVDGRGEIAVEPEEESSR